MTTVLIVEDEYLVRVGLRTCMDWERHGFTLLDDAVDGEVAYQKILAQKPDIMLLDVKMPRMNGFELLEKLQNDGIFMNTIVLSCCDDFDSVRTALKYGVKDYINKLTLNPSDLLGVLNKIPVFAQPASTVSDAITAGNNLALIPDSATIFERIINKAAPVNGDCCGLFPSGYIACVSVIPNNTTSTLTAGVRLNMTFQILKNSGIESISCVNESGLVTLLLPAAMADKHIFTILKLNLEPALDASCAIGYSDFYYSVKDIYQKYTYAKQIENAAFWEDKGCVRQYIQLLVPTEECKSAFAALKKSISEHMIAKNLTGTIKAIDKFIDTFLHMDCLTPNDFIQYSVSVLKLFNSDSMENSYFQHQKSIIQAESVSAIQLVLHSFVVLYFAAANINSMQYTPVIAKAVEYIIANPSRFVQLSEMAHYVNMSEPYLSQLFKKETGENFITYVHRYKIDLAKTMLNNQLLIYETCDKIGFENPNYFAKIFKRFTGMSPKEYRSQIKNDIQ